MVASSDFGADAWSALALVLGGCSRFDIIYIIRSTTQGKHPESATCTFTYLALLASSSTIFGWFFSPAMLAAVVPASDFRFGSAPFANSKLTICA